MTESSLEAIAAALAMLHNPHLARLAQRSPLPKGMTLLLRAATGETEAIARGKAVTGRSEATLQKAAGFFIEQVLLSKQNDKYRVLGGSPDTPPGLLRRHLALLLKWLHPDLFPEPAGEAGFNRSAYVTLVTEAWETPKTEERRASYNALLKGDTLNNRSSRKLPRQRRTGRGPLVIYRLEKDSLWSRLLSFIRL
jgi:hypothetical protein